MKGSVRLVARTSTTLWRRELASIVGVPERALSIGLMGLALMTVVFSLFLAWVLNEFVSSVVPTVDVATDQRPLLRLVLAGVMLATAVYFLVVCATLPPRHRLATALALLPVQRWRAQAGTLLPAFIVGFGVALILGLPSLPMIVKLVDPARFNPAALLAFVAVIALIALLVPGLFFFLREQFERFIRLPLAYSLALAVASTLLVVLAAVGIDLIPQVVVAGESPWYLLLPARAMAEVLQPGSSTPFRCVVASAGLLAWISLATALAGRLIHHAAPSEGRPVATPTIRLPEKGSRPAAMLMFEIVMLTRLPQFIVTTMVLALASVVIPIAYVQVSLQTTVDQLVSLPVVAACAIGAYSFGATRRVHWIGATIARNRLWILPKPAAALIISTLLSAPYLILLWVVGLPEFRLFDIVVLGVCMWASAVLAGVLVPFVADQPLSAAVTSATTVVLWALSTFGLRWLFGAMQIEASVVPALCWLGIALAVYAALATSRRSVVTASA